MLIVDMETNAGICYRYDEQPYGHLMIRKKNDRSFESLGLVDFRLSRTQTWDGELVPQSWVTTPPTDLELGTTHERLYIYAKGMRRTAGWYDLQSRQILWQIGGAGPGQIFGILNHRFL